MRCRCTPRLPRLPGSAHAARPRPRSAPRGGPRTSTHHLRGHRRSMCSRWVPALAQARSQVRAQVPAQASALRSLVQAEAGASWCHRRHPGCASCGARRASVAWRLLPYAPRSARCLRQRLEAPRHHRFHPLHHRMQRASRRSMPRRSARPAAGRSWNPDFAMSSSHAQRTTANNPVHTWPLSSRLGTVNDRTEGRVIRHAQIARFAFSACGVAFVFRVSRCDIAVL